MLTSPLLQTPGLGLFYGGMVAQNNAINTIMMSIVAICLVTVHWVVFGYSLSFGKGTPGFGSFEFVGLTNVGEAPIDVYAPTIPHTVFMLYQLMFAIITPGMCLRLGALLLLNAYFKLSSPEL